jgi:ubiquinone/menaquinone biosynthesis C-methylase UbiE
MTPSQSSDESQREYTRTAWNATAEKYLKVLRVFEPYGFDLLARVNPKIRESALDLATGPGEPAMSIARMVGPDGRVVGIDLSEEMVQLATRIAKDRRIPGVTFLAMDAEKLDFPDESFDLVTSRFGFQIFANPEFVARESYRVLRPKGRIGVAVWSTADKATAIDAVVGPMLEFAEPDETGYQPTPFQLGGSGELAKLLADAGFGEIQEERRTHTMAFTDEDEYLELLVESTPLGHLIKEEDPPVQKKILAKTRANLRKWKSRKGILIPCEGVIVTATK